MIQNAAARLVFNEPKRAHVTKHLKHWCLHIEQPQAQHPLTSTPIQNAGSLSTFKQQLKTHLFDTTWLHPKCKKKKKKKNLSFSLFIPSLASLYLFEQCLRRGVMGTSSVCLPLYDESLHVFPNCKSLWIKASAKWLNVDVNVKYKIIFLMSIISV